MDEGKKDDSEVVLVKTPKLERERERARARAHAAVSVENTMSSHDLLRRRRAYEAQLLVCQVMTAPA